MQQLQKSTLQLPTGSFRVCKGLTETHKLHLSWECRQQNGTQDEELWRTLKLCPHKFRFFCSCPDFQRFCDSMSPTVSLSLSNVCRFGHHLIQGHKTIIFPKEGCNSFRHYFYYTFADQFLQKATMFKTLKLVTSTVTLENWLKCHLNTLLSKTSFWHIFAHNFTLVL